MTRKMILAGLLAATLCAAGTARADEADQCTQDCAAGKAKAGFADGQRATCVCVEPVSGMDPTVVDSSAQSPGAQDAGASGQAPDQSPSEDS